MNSVEISRAMLFLSLFFLLVLIRRNYDYTITEARANGTKNR